MYIFPLPSLKEKKKDNTLGSITVDLQHLLQMKFNEGKDQYGEIIRQFFRFKHGKFYYICCAHTSIQNAGVISDIFAYGRAAELVPLSASEKQAQLSLVASS